MRQVQNESMSVGKNDDQLQTKRLSAILVRMDSLSDMWTEGQRTPEAVLPGLGFPMVNSSIFALRSLPSHRCHCCHLAVGSSIVSLSTVRGMLIEEYNSPLDGAPTRTASSPLLEEAPSHTSNFGPMLCIEQTCCSWCATLYTRLWCRRKQE